MNRREFLKALAYGAMYLAFSPTEGIPLEDRLDSDDSLRLTVDDENNTLTKAVHKATKLEGLELYTIVRQLRNLNDIGNLEQGTYEFRYEPHEVITIDDILRSVDLRSTRILGPPTVSAELIDLVLKKNKSPAYGNGEAFFNLGVLYGVDPVFLLAFFKKESSFGKAGVAVKAKSIGNIKGKGPAGSVRGRSGYFKRYHDFVESAEAWYKYMAEDGPYIKYGRLTVEKILPIYAPSFENNTRKYIEQVKKLIFDWRNFQKRYL